MKLKLFGIFILGLITAPGVCNAAVSPFYEDSYSMIVADQYKSDWNYSTNYNLDNLDNVNLPVFDTVLAGGIGSATSNAGIYLHPYVASRGFVAMVAMKIVARGGYFCPVQIQCESPMANSKNNESWTNYYQPVLASANWDEYNRSTSDDSANTTCYWLCEPGYSGVNCAAYSDTSVNEAFCDDKSFIPKTPGGKIPTYAMDKSYNSWHTANSVKSKFTAFGRWDFDGSLEKNKREDNVVIALTQYQDHGAMAAPIHIKCGLSGDNEGNNPDIGYGYVERMGQTTSVLGNSKMLCAKGYVLSGSTCVPKDACANAPMPDNFCSGYNENSYDPTIHDLYESGGCVKFKCEGDNHGFEDFSDQEYNCVPCTRADSESWNTGINTSTNECVFCDDFEYFDPTTSTCDELMGLSQIDLQYGRGKTNNTATLSEQCWTITDPVNYRNCVLGNALTIPNNNELPSKEDAPDIGSLTAVPSN